MTKQTLAQQKIGTMIRTFREPILSHSVLVYDQKTNENGSGVLVEIGTKTFILTAAHVIENDEILINMGFPGQQDPFSIITRWTDTSLDVGYLELNPYEVELRRGDHICPYKIGAQQEQKAQHLATTFVLCGFPTEYLIQNGNVRKPTPVLVWCALAHRSKWPQFIVDLGKTPETNFVVVYGETEDRSFFDEDGKRIELVSPFGLSGSGLWYFDLGTQNEEHPTYSLAGIQTSYVKTEKKLIGTFADKIGDSICSRYKIGLKIIE